MDILKKAVATFDRLKEFEYRILLSAGREKPLESILINFLDEDLFHILGLQHLSDIELPKNKKLVHAQICNDIITTDYLSMSEYYDNVRGKYSIKQRIERACDLEAYMDSSLFTVSVYKLQHVNHTNIRADYLITCKRNASEEEYYIFIRKRKELDSYGIISCFLKNNATYWGGRRYVLLKEKVKGNISCELYRHPNYQNEGN